MRQIVLACLYCTTCLVLPHFDSSLVGADEKAKVNRTRFYIADQNGKDATLFLVPGEFHNVGSPAFSSDGQKLAFDGWKSQNGEGFANVQIIVANADGSDMKVIGPGAMPSWSPGGKRIAFSQPSPNGVVIMNADGSKLKMIQERGWGAQWSPDGRKIAYSLFDSGKANIQIYDLIEETKTMVFPAGESPYSNLYWNMSWSPDSNWLCFKGRNASDNTYEVGTVNTAGMKEGFKVHYKNKKAPSADFAWHPQGDKIIFFPNSNPATLVQFNPAEDKAPEPFNTVVKGKVNGGVCFTPDGQNLLFTVRGEE